MDLNIWAILVALVVGYSIGGVWYSPLLFAKAWIAEMGEPAIATIRAHPSKLPFLIAAAANLAIAVSLAVLHGWIGADTFWSALGQGLGVGLIVGLGIVGASAAPHYAFQGSSLRLFLVDYGQTLASVLAMSLITALWR